MLITSVPTIGINSQLVSSSSTEQNSPISSIQCSVFYKRSNKRNETETYQIQWQPRDDLYTSRQLDLRDSLPTQIQSSEFNRTICDVKPQSRKNTLRLCKST